MSAPTYPGVAGVDVSPEALAPLIAIATDSVTDTEAPASASAPTAPFDALALLVEVTHDLRSPLGALLMLVERLRSGDAGPLTPTQERLLALVQGATFSMATLTDDALDLARGGTGLAEVPPAAFAVTDVLAAVRALVQPLAEEHGLALRFSAPPLGRRVGRAQLVQRVLLNLVTNACKYTDRGSVTVTVESREDEWVTFFVQDTGSGLPKEMQAMLRTLDSVPAGVTLRDAPPVPGAGVGLALCSSLLRAIDSRLCWSTPPQGGALLQFSVRLPVAP